MWLFLISRQRPGPLPDSDLYPCSKAGKGIKVYGSWSQSTVGQRSIEAGPPRASDSHCSSVVSPCAYFRYLQRHPSFIGTRLTLVEANRRRLTVWRLIQIVFLPSLTPVLLPILGRTQSHSVSRRQQNPGAMSGTYFPSTTVTIFVTGEYGNKEKTSERTE